MRKKTDSQSGRTVSVPATLDELMQRLLAEQSAFRAFLRKRLSDDALVEDLLHQSLVKAVERGHELNNRDSAVSWFYRILRNAVVDYYRSHAADRRKVDGFLDELVTSGEDKMPASVRNSPLQFQKSVDAKYHVARGLAPAAVDDLDDVVARLPELSTVLLVRGHLVQEE